MALTDAQNRLLKAGPRTVEPSGDQTPEQARNFLIDSFRYACSFEGIGIPSRVDVEAELEATDPS